MVKRIVVTGANRGIGLEVVRQYLQDNWDVIATCRSPESAHDLNALKAQCTNTLKVIPLDVTQQQHINSMAAILKDESVDILFNNAGIYGPKSAYFGENNTEQWLNTLHVNTISPLKMIEALADSVAASKHKTIVTITSKMGSMGDNGSGGCYIYRSSKAALNAVLKSAAIDLAPRGIKILMIHPGWVKTDMGGPNAKISTEQSVTGIRQVIQRTTLQDSGAFIDYAGSPVPW